MAFIRRKLKLKKAIIFPLLVFLVLGGILAYYFSHAAAFTGNSGTAAWGDSTLGRLRVDAYTYPTTYATSFRPTAPVSSAIQFVVNKAAPTRNEKLVGYQLNDGRLYVAKCTSTCTGTGNLTASSWTWATPTILGTNVVTRAFDIAYEQLSGRAMVVYAGNTTGELYYCIWDGTSWGPVSSCQPTNGVNNIALTDGTTTLTGTPAWVTLSPYGSQYGANRSNDILMAVEDTNNDLLVMHWNGSSWLSGDSKVLTTTGGATVTTSDDGSQEAQSFDIGWESLTGMEMAVYADGTAFKYATSTGSGWSAGTTIATPASAVQWARLGSDPLSNRMSLITSFGSTSTGSTATATPYIWKTNGSTVGWTALTTQTMDLGNGQDISTAWLKAGGGTPEAMFTAPGNATSTNGQRTWYATWTQVGGLAAWAQTTATASGDIITSNEIIPSPNSDIINLQDASRDGKLRNLYFSGSAWSGTITTLANGNMITTKTGHTNNKVYIQKPYQFSYKPYSPWSMNWEAFSDTTDATPVTPYGGAGEDTEPAVGPGATVRLRVNVAELGGQGETADTNGVRVKLQYSSGAGCPDSITCTWSDVASSGTPWIYSTASGMTDDAKITSSVLSGTSTSANGGLGEYFTNGTASAPNSVQVASAETEYDFTLQNNGSTVGTDYYFRLYDYGSSTSGGSMTNLGPIYREQITDINGNQNTDCSDGSTSISCTYPTLLSYSTAPNPPVWDSVPSGTTTPVLQLAAADGLNNGLQYTIEWCPTNSFPSACPAGGGSFDETVDQTNWTGQDITCSGSPCYTGSVNLAGSTIATYTVPGGIFAPSTTYYLRAKAIDPPPGLNVAGSYSSTATLTTGALQVLIKGGSCIGNKTDVSGTVTPCCNPVTSAKCVGAPSNVRIGN